MFVNILIGIYEKTNTSYALTNIALNGNYTAADLPTSAYTGKTIVNMELLKYGGDVNGDGDINAIDAAQVLISTATVGTGGEPTIEVALGDIDSDGKADASDASKILIYSAEAGAGYEGSLPEYFNLVQ